MQQNRGKHSMFWWCTSTKQGKHAIQNARVCAIWIIYALESATRFDRVGVLSSQAAQRRETERFVRSLADDEGFCLGYLYIASMAEFDLTSKIGQYLDRHLVFPLLEFLSVKEVSNVHRK